MNLGNLLFSFTGRINRAKWWLFILIYVIAAVILGIVNYVLARIGIGIIGSLLSLVVGIALLIGGIAVGIKRLHDRDKSGWLLLLIYFGPAVLVGIGFGLALSGAGGIPVLIAELGAAAIGIWAFVELGCLRGTVGPNQYGPDPLGIPGG